MDAKIRKFILKKRDLDKITTDYTDYHRFNVYTVIRNHYRLHRFKFKNNIMKNEDLFRYLWGFILGLMCFSKNMSLLTRLRKVP